MTTKIFFALCLFMGIAMIQLPAQNGRNGTGTVVWDNYYDIFDPVYYNGELIDFLSGKVTWHNRDHYVDGVYQYTIATVVGEITSEFTHEVFRINEQDKAINGYWYSHSNILIVGDKGSHYILFCWANQSNWDDWGISKIILPGQKGK